MRAALVLIAASTACKQPRIEPVAVPTEGLAIAIYAVPNPTSGDGALAIIDDRRVVEVANGSVTIDNIDPEASLPSLVIEPLGGDLVVEQCVRERIDASDGGLDTLAAAKPLPRTDAMARESPSATLPAGVLSPLVRCTVRGKPGRHLVRILYTARGFRFHAQHDIAMTTPERARIATRFAIETPRWNRRGSIILYDRPPGGREPPRELVAGAITLDGGTSVIALPVQDAPARLRTVYDGGVKNDLRPRDPGWRREAQTIVWVWLELDTVLVKGPVHAHIDVGGDVHEMDIPPSERERLGTGMRVPLWIEAGLRGGRQRWVESSDDGNLVERFQLSVSNSTDAPRDVWIEEHLRPAKHREPRSGSPGKPTLVNDLARSHVTVGPHTTERIAYTLVYEF